MKVLVVSHLWPRSNWQHLGVFVAEQVAPLAKRCKVSVIVPVDQRIRREELAPRQFLSGFSGYRQRVHPEIVPIANVGITTVAFRAAGLRDPFASVTARRLQRALQSVPLEEFDLVHAHTLFPDGLACALWLKNESIPLVVTAHGSDVHSIGMGVRRTLGTLFQRANALVSVSQFLKDRLLEFGAAVERIHVIPNGFPSALFAAVDDARRNPVRIAYLGRLDKIKRVDLLIRSMAHCRREIVLDIAGDGACRKNYEALVNTLGLKDRVRFLGMLPRSEVPQFLAGAALMCLVSQKEGWPTVILEALACGTPVLATAVGGIPEALEDPALGRLVPVNATPITLAKEIERALDYEWNRQFLKDRAMQCSWDVVAERLHAIYEDLLGGKVNTS